MHKMPQPVAGISEPVSAVSLAEVIALNDGI
jgi:hypothetical protein